MRKLLVALAIFFQLLPVIGCSESSPTGNDSDNDGDTGREPKVIATVSCAVTPESGGQLNLATPAGDEIILEIPANAVDAMTTITLEAYDISPANPIDANVFPGLTIHPEDLALYRKASLSIKPASPVSDAECTTLFRIADSSLIMPLAGHTIESSVIRGSLYRFGTCSCGVPTVTEMKEQVERMIAVMTASKPASCLGAGDYQETFEVVHSLLHWYELLTAQGETVDAQKALDEAKRILEEAASEFLNEPPPVDPCGDYINTLANFMQAMMLTGVTGAVFDQAYSEFENTLNKCTTRFRLEKTSRTVTDMSQYHDEKQYSGDIIITSPMYGVGVEYGTLEGGGSLLLTGSGQMGNGWWTYDGSVDVEVGGELIIRDDFTPVLDLELTETMHVSQTACNPQQCATVAQPVEVHSYQKQIPVDDGWTQIIDESYGSTTITITYTLHIERSP